MPQLRYLRKLGNLALLRVHTQPTVRCFSPASPIPTPSLSLLAKLMNSLMRLRAELMHSLTNLMAELMNSLMTLMTLKASRMTELKNSLTTLIASRMA